MRTTLFSILFVAFAGVSFAQDSKWSVEANYPLPVDQNFIGKNYSGLIDLGARYRFVDLGVARLGASVNGGFLKNSKADAGNPYDVNLYTLQPRVFAEFALPKLSKWHPSVGLGYSFLFFDAESDGSNPELSGFESHTTENGFNANLGLSYDVTKKFFVQVQYDFIKIGVDDNVPDTSYNSNIGLLKLGIGYRI